MPAPLSLAHLTLLRSFLLLLVKLWPILFRSFLRIRVSANCLYSLRFKLGLCKIKGADFVDRSDGCCRDCFDDPIFLRFAYGFFNFGSSSFCFSVCIFLFLLCCSMLELDELNADDD